VSEVAILVPVLRRPHRVEPLLASIFEATADPHVLFVCDPNDRIEINTILDHNKVRPDRSVDHGLFAGNYAEKIAAGVHNTDEPLVFTAADDLHFHPGWLEAAKAKLLDGVEVVGVNDLIARGREHATHFLMTRDYAERPTADGGPGPFHQGYFHWCVDDELIATAKARDAYAYAPDAHVEHLHPMAGKAEDDEVYEQGRARGRLDRRLFRRREPLWT
jgi:hypothetical protein